MYLSMEVAQIMVQADAPKPQIPILISREKEVLAPIAEGLTNNLIKSLLNFTSVRFRSARIFGGGAKRAKPRRGDNTAL